MSKIQHSIELISFAQNAADAFEAYTKSMADFGYEKVVYTLCTDHPSLKLPKQHGLSTNYPEDWMGHYVENGLIKSDPVVNECIKTRTPFYWDSILNKQAKNSDELTLMMDARDAGLASGIGVSFGAGYGEITGIGLASDDDLSAEQSYANLAAIHLVSSFFHETYRNFILPKEKIKLSPKEEDVLCWAAEGKIDDEIATLMNLSVHTVHYHWKNISLKLNTFNRTHAVSKALRQGLITPGLITY